MNSVCIEKRPSNRRRRTILMFRLFSKSTIEYFYRFFVVISDSGVRRACGLFQILPSYVKRNVTQTLPITECAHSHCLRGARPLKRNPRFAVDPPEYKQ